MDENRLRSFGEGIISKLLGRLQADGTTKEDIRSKVDAEIAYRSSPEGQAETKQKEVEWDLSWRAKEQARQDAKAAKVDGWRENHAYRWMLAPVPVFDEETEKTVLMPLSNDSAEVEAIRESAARWETGDQSRKLYAHLFDELAHFEMDWESIVRRERQLALEAIDGVPFVTKDDPITFW